MVLARIKRWLGVEDLSEYERETLTREYRELEEKIASIERQLGTVKCKSCPKSLDPEAERLLNKKRSHEDRQQEIEKRLGEAPTTKRLDSRRASKRANA